MKFLCPSCKASAAVGDRFCRACGTALPKVSAPSADVGQPTDSGAPERSWSVSRLDFTPADALAILPYAAGGLLVLLFSYHLLSQAFSFSSWELAAASLAVACILVKLFIDSGLRSILHYGIYLSIYCAGGVAVLAIAANARPEDVWPSWQIWLIYTGVFSLLALGLPPLARRTFGPATDRSRLRAIAEKAEEAHMQREAALTQLPSHSWYLLACWVTAVAMFGSFATTAIGFYEEIVDPHSHWLIRFGVPIGLSAMAAFIIWSGWNFVFLRMRVAAHVWTRSFAFAVGFAILVPLTLAIHTVFGIIGIGGTEGLRAHYMWYADVLSGYQKRADDLRLVELSFLTPLEQMGARFSKLASDETNPAARARCGTGQGDLWKYYSERSTQVAAIIEQISVRKGTSLDLPKQIEGLRKDIRDPGVPFRLAQERLEGTFAKLRSEIVNLEGRSVMNSIELFMSQLAIVVEQETFFDTWSSCQARSKDNIKQEISRFLTQVRKDRDTATGRIAAIKREAARHVPPERRVESFALFDRFVTSASARATAEDSAVPDATADNDSIPIFVPLRPFWAVVSYAGQLPGYIALQLALDFSPAILGVLFAVLAPLPSGPTRFGRLSDAATENVYAWLSRHRAPGVTKEPEVVSDEKAGAAEDVNVVGPAKREAGVKPKRAEFGLHAPESIRADAKLMSLFTRIAAQREGLFDDLGRCEALLSDTLLSQAEVDAMIAAAQAGTPQRLLTQPGGTVGPAAMSEAVEHLVRALKWEPDRARAVVTMWVNGLGLRIGNGREPSSATTG